MVNVDAYLERIGYEGPREPDPQVLRSLHLAHLRAVPFENLDIHLGRPIMLVEASLVGKIVGERRGGFCYELNGAFAALLRALGFEVSLLSARVTDPDGHGSEPFDHMCLEVACPDSSDRWLADVGFGEGFLEPLPLGVDAESPQANGTYRIARDGGELVLERSVGTEPFEAQFRFSLRPHQLSAFAGRCRFHQTSPSSHFTVQRVCSRATPEGRITLSEDRLIISEAAQRTDVPVRNDATFRAALDEYFGIVLVEDWVSPTG